jgi:quinol monooxygenase YgiN
MPQPLIYVDTSDIREGALEELREASRKLAEFIEENEPQLLSYSVYFSEDADQIAFVHVHADQASLDYHMDIAGPRFARFADLLTLRSIHIYGEPSEKALAQLREKVRLLGSGDVVVHPPHAGFGRLLPEQRTAGAG